MVLRFFNLFLRAPFALAALAGPADGEVKWNIDTESGRWSITGPSLALKNVTTSVEVDGARIELGRGEAGAAVQVRDAIGEGERTVFKSASKDVELSLAITRYKNGTQALVEATLRNVSDKPQIVTEFRAFQGNVKTQEAAAQCRFYKNSGTQGPAGVFPIGQGEEQRSAYVGCMFDPATKSSLGIGMVSYHRADATITTRVTGEHELDLMGTCYFTRVPILPGEALSSEAYLLEWSDRPLAALEHYADALAAIHKIKVSTNREGFWNIWYAYAEEENSEENLFKCAEYQKRELAKWGIPCLSTGAWQRENAFMEERVKPELYPKGLKVVSQELRKRGIIPGFGGFFARVTETTPLFKEHPEWMVRGADGAPFMANKFSWGRCPYPHYLPDMTHPGMQKWYRDYWESFVSLGYREHFWIDFEGGSSKGTRFNPSLNAPFETDRLRIGIIRDVVGKDAQIGSYTSPTNRYLGLVDRVRTGPDVGLFGSSPKWAHLRNVARNMAAAWFYHNRVWINDPDPPMVGLQPDATRLEEARIRLLIVGMSGGFITLGERMPDMDPAQFRLLSTVMPPYGTAARPIDLFRNELPEVQDLTVKTDWDTWHVVSVINWEESAAGNLPVEVQADSEGIAGNKQVYAAGHAFDGRVETSLASPGACWTSAKDKQGEHWISASFRAPIELNGIAIHWTTYKKFDPEVEWWTSANYDIQAWDNEGWKTVAEVHNDVPVAGVPVTTHRFRTVKTSRLRILQPQGGGPSRRNNMMAISEVELNPASETGKAIHVDFAELGLKHDEEYFVYEFWSQKSLGRLRNGMTLSLPPHTSRLLGIRALPRNPWVVGTDLHVSQGGVELREVKWNAAAQTLSGVAQRPGEKGKIIIYAPNEFAVKKGEVDGRPVDLPAFDGEIMRLPVAFQGEPVRWSVTFSPR